MASRIPQDFINEILSRTDIIELIQARIKLTRRGQNHHGLCPFHQEKSPSFSANHSKQFYYCFGCGASGNAIGFIMQYDQLEFRDAVEYLANQLGLELPTDETDDNSALYKQLHEIMQAANLYYQQQLRRSEPAKEYLIARGLNGTIAKTFNIGFVTEGWNHLSQHFNSKSQQQLLSQAGMLKQKSDRQYDTFRHRIMFPIRNTRGQVVGFGGRSIDQSPPKYLNSPETIIFHKNNELFGLFEAKQSNKKCAHLIVVEGYMDVIALHQFGITQAVATLGTAINRNHIQKLLRYTNHVIFCFDGDRAGRSAAWKALCTCLPFLREGICFQFFSVADGEDPDSLVRKKGANAFNLQLSESPEITTMLFNELHQRHQSDTLSGQASLAKDAMELINTMPSCIFKEIMIEQLAKEIQLDKTQIQPLIQQPSPTVTAPALTTAEETTAEINTTEKNTAIELNHPLTPTMIVAAIIIQHPALASSITEETFMHQSTVESHWLQYIVKTIKERTIENTFEIFNFIKQQNRPVLAQLAQHDLTIPASGLEKELSGALDRIREQGLQSTLHHLIQKSKTQPLSTTERIQLKQILDLKNKKLLEDDIP